MKEIRNIIYSIVAIITFGFFAVSPRTQAVSPAPDGGYLGANTAEGQNALLNLSGGTYNTAIGWLSLTNDIFGSFNTATGAGTLLSNNGDQNTATGTGALLSNTTGATNMASGAFALFSDTTGSGNIALGSNAGINLTTGNNNIEIGNVGLAGESNTIRIGDAAIQQAIFVAGITPMTPTAPNQAVLVNPVSGQLGSVDVSSFGVVITTPENTAVGDQALASNAGESNTATGFQALFKNTVGNQNTASGAKVLSVNIDGTNNTAIGAFALSSNVGGDPTNSKGSYSNAVGANSLSFNVDGAFNNAFGESALLFNLHASGNTAVGDIALTNNDSSGLGQASDNTAVGAEALLQNNDGNSNNAVGSFALSANVGDTNGNGSFNNVIGVEAMASNVNGSGNVAVGDSAGLGVEGSFNIYIGFAAGPSMDGSQIPEDETIRIGDSFNFACFIGGISGVPVSGDPVVVNGEGRLGVWPSSARFKDDIKPMDKASEAILALKPVTFRYKKEIDIKGTQHFGLGAEQVAQVSPALVILDTEGKPYSVRYDQVNAMLLNEFLKEHRKVEQQGQKIQEQEAAIAELKSGVETLAAAVKGQATQIQKVNAKISTSRPAPQLVRMNEPAIKY
jgi:hypothetical protein